MENRNGTHRIVMTGGPGAGKSTAADLIRRELGEKIVVVPETATLLYSGGFPRSNEASARFAAQHAIYHVQRNMEDVQTALYPGRVLLCDRGTLDGAIYWPDEDKDTFFEAMNTTLEKEYDRYDGVIFFETAAVGGISIEGGNPIRTESNKRAVELDGALREVWSKHPCFTLVKHQDSFFAKLKNALDAMNAMIVNLDGKKCT